MTIKQIEERLTRIAAEIDSLEDDIAELERDKRQLENEQYMLEKALDKSSVPPLSQLIFNQFKELMIFSPMTVFEIRYHLLGLYPDERELIFEGI